jgi:hypothetical protein
MKRKYPCYAKVSRWRYIGPDDKEEYFVNYTVWNEFNGWALVSLGIGSASKTEVISTDILIFDKYNNTFLK